MTGIHARESIPGRQRTTAGTALVKDILVGTGDGLSNFYSCWQHNGYLYFVATSLAASDFEIWKSDGTTLGTSKIKDIYLGANGSYPHTFFEFNAFSRSI